MTDGKVGFKRREFRLQCDSHVREHLLPQQSGIAAPNAIAIELSRANRH
jgi:hypothetical protein